MTGTYTAPVFLSPITHKLTLDRINEGFDLMHKGESIRSVVLF